MRRVLIVLVCGLLAGCGASSSPTPAAPANAPAKTGKGKNLPAMD